MGRRQEKAAARSERSAATSHTGPAPAKPAPNRSITIFLGVVLILWNLTPVLPALVTRFVPFPSLEEAEYLEGSFAYEGDWPQARLPRYFVVSASGRHEFHCGYLGARHTCFTQPAVFVGQRMKVWNSFWYGSIQHQVEPRTGRIPYPLDVWDWRYADSRALSLDPRYSRAGSINWFAIVLLGGYAAWLAIRHRWARGESRAG